MSTHESAAHTPIDMTLTDEQHATPSPARIADYPASHRNVLCHTFCADCDHAQYVHEPTDDNYTDYLGACTVGICMCLSFKSDFVESLSVTRAYMPA